MEAILNYKDWNKLNEQREDADNRLESLEHIKNIIESEEDVSSELEIEDDELYGSLSHDAGAGDLSFTIRRIQEIPDFLYKEELEDTLDQLGVNSSSYIGSGSVRHSDQDDEGESLECTASLVGPKMKTIKDLRNFLYTAGSTNINWFSQEENIEDGVTFSDCECEPD